MPTKKTTTTRKTTKKAQTKTARTAAKKKVVKRVTAKKPKKRVATKQKPVLVCADGGSCFWVHDGPILKDLVELRDALAEMSPETFSYHANKERNDFADWIESILGDKTLATSFRKSRKPNTARTLVVKRLRYYQV